MSWLDKLSNDLIITTGDSKQYKPLWKNPSKSTGYNHAEFTFPNLTGSLVKRGTPIGRRFPLELYFDGTDHLDKSSEFEKSASDKRAWRIEHPYYGLLFVQPTEINFDNIGDNVTKITTVVIETITEDKPSVKTDPIDSIKLTKVQLDGVAEQNITATIQPTNINTLTDVNKKAFNLSVPIIKLPTEAEGFYNTFNQAQSAINTATATPILAMRAVIAALSYPANFQVSVQTRINTLKSTFDNLRATVAGIPNVAGKQIYQVQGAAILSAMCIGASTPVDKDYTNSKSVLGITSILSSSYNQYLTDLDSIQSLNGGNITSFIPSPDTINLLDGLLNFTIANLYNIALSSRTERSIITEKDTNIILLTQRFYGLDPNDDNINELISNNNWSLSQVLQIKKNTKVVYYI